MRSVGLQYLTLARSAASLSGGERIRLATQIGSSLMGVLYILTSLPSACTSVTTKTLKTLFHLRDLGNTLIVVNMMRIQYAAQTILHIGPGAGIHGGEVVCAGTADDIIACENL